MIVHDDYIFVGVSSEEDFNSKKVARTNLKAVNFLKSFQIKNFMFRVD